MTFLLVNASYVSTVTTAFLNTTGVSLNLISIFKGLGRTVISAYAVDSMNLLDATAFILYTPLLLKTMEPTVLIILPLTVTNTFSAPL